MKALPSGDQLRSKPVSASILPPMLSVKNEEKVPDSEDYDQTVVYLYACQKIIETRDGSKKMTQQFIGPLTRRAPRSGYAIIGGDGVLGAAA